MGVWHAAAEDSRLFGILICLFSLIFFIGAIFYARHQGIANKTDTAVNSLNKQSIDGDNSQ